MMVMTDQELAWRIQELVAVLGYVQAGLHDGAGQAPDVDAAHERAIVRALGALRDEAAEREEA